MNRDQIIYNSLYVYTKELTKEVAKIINETDIFYLDGSSKSLTKDSCLKIVESISDLMCCIDELSKAELKAINIDPIDPKKLPVYQHSAGIVSRRLFSGWKTYNNQIFLDAFYGNNSEKSEASARDYCATHLTCKKCKSKFEKSYKGMCDTCYSAMRTEQFLNFPTKLYKDCSSVVAIFDTDIFFFTDSDLDNYIDSNDIKLSDLQIVECKQSKLREIDISDFADDLPSFDCDPDTKLLDYINEFNRKVAELNCGAWYQTDIRVIFEEDNQDQKN